MRSAKKSQVGCLWMRGVREGWFKECKINTVKVVSVAFRFLRLLDFSSCFCRLFSKQITCTSTSEVYLCNSSDYSGVNVTPVLVGKCFPLHTDTVTWISVFPLKALTLTHFFCPRWNRTSPFLTVTPFICGSVLLPLLLLRFRPEQISFECDLP